MSGTQNPSNEMIVHRQSPFNAEPQSSELVADFITPQARFYIRNHGDIPDLGIDHRVELTGLIAKSSSFTLADLRRDFPERKVTAVLQCAGNRRADLQEAGETSGDLWSHGAIGNGEWTGIALADVLRRAEIDRARARFVAFTCADQAEADGENAPYGVSISLDRALEDDVLIAWGLNGEALTPAHGAPMRIIVPDYAGVRSAKWIKTIEVRDGPSPSPIQSQDYKLYPASVSEGDADAALGLTIEEMPVNSAICIPEQGQNVPAGITKIEGYAVAYRRAIARVDVSTDGGGTWTQASLRTDPDARAAWTLWSLEAELEEGICEIVVKAVDAAGQSQPENVEPIWNFAGYLSTAWHRIKVSVS